MDPSPVTPDSPKPRTMLIVDDSRTVLEVAKIYLMGHNLLFLVAASGEEALRVAEQQRPDIILCDIQMPHMNGYELCQAVKAHPALGRVPVILMTAKPEELSHLKAIGAGASGFLTKPMNPDKLCRLVESLLT